MTTIGATHKCIRGYETIIFLNQYSQIPKQMNLVQKIWEAKHARSHEYDYLVPLVSYELIKAKIMSASRVHPVIHEIRDPAAFNSVLRVVFDCEESLLVVSVRRGRDGRVLRICALATLCMRPAKFLLGKESMDIHLEALLAEYVWCKQRGSGSHLLHVMTTWLSGAVPSEDASFLFLLKPPSLPVVDIRLRVYALNEAIPFYICKGFCFDFPMTCELKASTAGASMSLYIPKTRG
jgi:hypothetical protein